MFHCKHKLFLLRQEPYMSDTQKKKSGFKTVVAFILDLITSFSVFGYIIAKFTGDTTEGGFELNGMPALILFALVIAYMAMMPRFGGRLWQRIFGVAK
jgi:ABC-type transport system involved in cytochrome bd biosynthesis fused ATPase/permease subunit